MVIMLPGMTIKEEFYYYNIAINIVAIYYYFQEGGAATILYKRLLTRWTSPILLKEISP
jgi:hypothetical protein